MPARVVQQDRPTFYLDTSTLCDAFLAHAVSRTGSPDRAYMPLLPWIERVTEEANLCLSIVHLLELSRWSEHEAANAIARWLDERPIVWVRGMADVQDDEDEYWVRIALGAKPEQPVQPFAPSMLTAMHDINVQSSPDALLVSRIPDMLQVLRGIDTVAARNDVQSMMHRFHADRQWAQAEGWSEERKQQELAYRSRIDLRQRADAARSRVVARGESLPQENDDGEHVQDLLVALIDRDQRAMPSWRVADAFSSGLATLAGRRTPGSKRSAQLDSSFEDYVHLAIGAGYCDIFSCDADVSSCLGDVRERFGLERQHSVKDAGGPSGFVTQLMSKWP